MKGGTPRGARQVRIQKGNMPSMGVPPKQSGIPWVNSKKNNKKDKK